MKFSETAIKVLEQRYLLKDEQGKIIETPEQMFKRVAKGLAEAERYWTNDEEKIKQYENAFFNIMYNRDFLPNSPTLFHAGLPKDAKYKGKRFMSACIVLPIEDSIDGIFKSLSDAAKIFQAGGGVGYSFSKLRPKGAVVKSSGGYSSGPVSFMHIFDKMAEVVAQGGKRRGAQMGVLSVHHPDIIEFIESKKHNTGKTVLHNFNISVAITEEFINAYYSNGEYNLIDPNSGNIVGKLNAREVMRKIVENAWRTGDPGIMFIDRINDTDYLDSGAIEATNPCGEQPLPPYGSCNLGSINLKHMLKRSGDKYEIDWKKFRSTIKLAVRILDNVIEINDYPIPELEEYAKKARRIGLGVMGWADMLSLLNIPYNSVEALDLARTVGKFLNEEAHKASQELAKERGTFEYYDKSKWKQFGVPMRNAAVTTIAPTGTLSILAGVNSGIEPYFALAYERKITAGTFFEVQETLLQVLQDNNLYSEDIIKKIIENEGKISNIKKIPAEIRRVFVTATEISPEWHIKMVSAWQENIDSSISKTINLPNDATQEDVEKVFIMAYELGLKAVTIYRDKSLEEQVLTIPETKKEEKKEETKPEDYIAKKIFDRRPGVLSGFTRKYKFGVGSLLVTVNLHENGRPVEVLTAASGSLAPAELESIARLVSLALQYGVPATEIIDQLTKPVDPVVYKMSPEGLKSTSHGIALALKEATSKGITPVKGTLSNLTISLTAPALNDEEQKQSVAEKEKKEKSKKITKEQIEDMKQVYGEQRVKEILEDLGIILCPACGEPMSGLEGCWICSECGYSKCD